MKYVIFAAVASTMVMLSTGGSAMSDDKIPLKSTKPADAASEKQVSDCLSRLQTGNSDERIQAARELEDIAPLITPQLVHSLGQPLLHDADPALRIQVISTFRSLAARHNRRAPKAEKYEPQVLSLLGTAYDQESNADVKRCIVQALAEFNDPEAVELLNEALVDADPGIRECAQKAKLQRDRRLFFARCG